MSCSRIKCKPINYQSKHWTKKSRMFLSPSVCLHTRWWMKRYTFAKGTFTCLIIGFDSRCIDKWWEKSINCTHCFSPIINFLLRTREREWRLLPTFWFVLTRNSDVNVPSSSSRMKPWMVPLSRIDQASVPDRVLDCSSWQRHCSAIKRGAKGAKREKKNNKFFIRLTQLTNINISSFD